MVFIVIVFVISLSIRKDKNAISLTIEAEAVSLLPDRNLILKVGTSNGTRGINIWGVQEIIGISSIILKNGEWLDVALDAKSALLTFTASRSAETRLVVVPGRRFDISTAGAAAFEVQAMASDMDSKISLTLNSPTDSNNPAPRQSRPLSVPTALTFSASTVANSDYRSGIQFSVPLTGSDMALIISEDFNVRRLGFTTSENPSDVLRPQFRSTIMSGKIRLRDVEQEIELHRHEPLIFENLAARVTVLEIFGDRVKIQLTGHADRIRIGPPGFQKELAPSLARYFLNNPAFYPVVLVLGSFGGMIFDFIRNMRKRRTDGGSGA